VAFGGQGTTLTVVRPESAPSGTLLLAMMIDRFFIFRLSPNI
jgi:hypothetical protein